ncbi:MAG TPA: hypothetical protein VEJ63_12155 [Planctomycetota bacterium]|nr:hypothetical protein [Planctomycetota bacterium]
MKTNLIIAFTTLFLGLIFWKWGEKMPVADGAGWDGRTYVHLVTHFDEVVQKGKLDAYYAQRLVPSTVMYTAFKVAGMEITHRRVIRLFDLYNVLLVACAAFFWGLIADHFRLRDESKWLGFFALFINFCMLKYNFYNPALTDTTAFFLGVVMIYLYLSQATAWLAIATVVAAFTWPTGLVTGLVLLVLPPGVIKVTQPRVLNWVIAASAAAIACALAYYTVRVLYYTHDRMHSHEFDHASIIFLFWFLLSIAYLIRLPAWPLRVEWKVLLVRLGIAALVFSCVYFTLNYLSSSASTSTLRKFVKANLALAVGRPLIFLVAHFAFFGPIICVLLLCWKKVSQRIADAGLGLALLGVSGLCLAIGSESRQLAMVIPLFMVFAVVVLDDMRLPRSFYVSFALGAILVSKVWLKMNVDVAGQAVDEDFLVWPWQRFFGSIGYYMSMQMYSIQATVLIVMCYLFHRFYLRQPAAALDMPAQTVHAPLNHMDAQAVNR